MLSIIIPIVVLALAIVVGFLLLRKRPDANSLRRGMGIGLVAIGALILILVPVVYVSLALSNAPESAIDLLILLTEYVFLLIGPLCLFVGILLVTWDTWRAGPTLTSGASLRWLIPAGGSVLIFVIAYLMGDDSLLGDIWFVVSLRDFLMWLSLGFLIAATPRVIEAFENAGWARKAVGPMYISVTIGFFLSLILIYWPIMRVMEETVVSLMFQTVRQNDEKIYLPYVRDSRNNPIGISAYCPSPEDKLYFALNEERANQDLSATVQGASLSQDFKVLPGIREDLRIVGITTSDISEVEGRWPLDWGIYAQVANRTANAENNILVYDINFLDDKGVFGGLECGRKFSCNELPGQPMVRQTQVLAAAIADHSGKVLADYPIETSTASREVEINYDARLQALLEKSAIRNVRNARAGRVWAQLPIAPIAPITEELDVLGHANVFIDPDTKLNRKVPIVIRVRNLDRQGAPDYNPDVDDWILPGIAFSTALAYYGVDPVNDVEVDFAAGYVKIKNIPEQYRQEIDWEQGGIVNVDVMANPPGPGEPREVIIPIDSLGLMNINFRGGRHCIHHDRILDVARHMPQEKVTEIYENEITLVAMYYATGVDTAKDIHLSPYGNMAGIEHQGYAINTILNQDFSTDVPSYVNLVILVVIAVLTAFFLPRVPLMTSFGLSIGIAIAYLTFSFLVTFDMLSLLHVVPTVVIEQILILIAFVLFRALAEEENVKFIRNTFSKFVSQDVVDELLTNPEAIALGGSKKEVSVFFSDVRGFTTISEALGPEELVKLLNEYLSEMTELIINYRGTIDKYMGDAIMAFWGAPVANDDHAYFTCVAAIAQAEALKVLQTGWSKRDIPVLDIGIGINSGQAVVGNMGSSRRMDYTLMGDTVNLGSRLEGITKTYGVKICMSEFTYERVKDRVYARELDLVRVKGKLEPVRIYELMGLKDDSDMEKLRNPGTPPPGYSVAHEDLEV